MKKEKKRKKTDSKIIKLLNSEKLKNCCSNDANVLKLI